MIKSKINFFLFLFILILLGCMRNDFYYDCIDGEWIRVPLIEPYQIISTNNGYNWYFSLTHYSQSYEIENVDSIGVIDSIFVVYSNSDFQPEIGDTKKATWFIIDTRSDIKYIYQDKARYISKLDSLNANNLKLYNPILVFHNFQKTFKWPKEWPKNNI